MSNSTACGVSIVCPQDSQFTMGVVDSIPVFGLTCEVIADNYRKQGNHWRDPKNPNIVAMFCPKGYQLPDDHWGPESFVCDTSASIMRQACSGTNPTNIAHPPKDPNDDTVLCCLGTSPSPSTKCGIGYCSNGNGCASTMSYYAANYGWEDGVVKKYLQTTTDSSIKNTIVQSLLQRYYGAVPDVRGNPGNKAALEFCAMVPGACDSKLNQVCKSIRNMKDLTSDPDVLNLCGCHLQTHMYDDAYGGIVEKQCSPSCVLPSVLKDTTVGECKQNVCVLDNINLNILNSTVSGDISISQVCPQASSTGAKTQCYMSDVNIDVINSLVGKGIDIQQNCSTCYLLNEKDGTTTEVPDCKSFNVARASKVGTSVKEKSSVSIPLFMIIAFVVLLLIGLLVWIFTKRKNLGR